MGIDQWQNFFVMVGGGAAALAGLVFIAMSINLSIITRDWTVPSSLLESGVLVGQAEVG
jgi:hypothetical protein